MRQRAEAGELCAVVRFASRARSHHRHDSAEMPGPQPPQMQVGELIALALDRAPEVVRHAGVGGHVEQDRARVADEGVGPQLAMTNAPTMPAAGSIHSQPKARARTRPTMTVTETAASPMTWMKAARRLLSRAAAPCACSCSSKATAWVSPLIVTLAANTCGSGISSTDSRKSLWSGKEKTCRDPSGRTVSTDVARALSAGPVSSRNPKRGATPSSYTSRTALPLRVSIRFDSSWSCACA